MSCGLLWLHCRLCIRSVCPVLNMYVSNRRGCILRLQRHLHELLLDQLPVLRQLARVLDEMTLGLNGAAAAAGGSAAGFAAASRLVIEQVGCRGHTFIREHVCGSLSLQR